MKRSSSSDLCVTKKQAIECSVCYELITNKKQCRTCKKHICRSCLKKWKAMCNNERRKPDCPNCRGIWDKPNFYIKAPQPNIAGRFINIYCGTSYVLAPICIGQKAEGFALLDPKLMKNPIHASEFVPSKLVSLEKYAADLKWLFKDLEQGPAVISTDIPDEQLKKKFVEAGVHLEEITQMDNYTVFGSLNFEEIIMAGLVMGFNPF